MCNFEARSGIIVSSRDFFLVVSANPEMAITQFFAIVSALNLCLSNRTSKLMLYKVCTHRCRIISFIRAVLKLGRSCSNHSFTLVLLHLLHRGTFFIYFSSFRLNLLCRCSVVRFLSSNTEISCSQIGYIYRRSMLCLLV